MAKLLSFLDKKKLYIKVISRLSFRESDILINFCVENYSKNLSQFNLDLSKCESMDSTFIGTIVRISLEAEKFNIKLILLNITDHCYHLLKELGLNEFFCFEKNLLENILWKDLSTRNSSKENQKNIIYNAHKTLVDIHSSNINEFGEVLDQLKSEINNKNND